MESVLVVKCGGSTMDQLPFHFFTAIAELQEKGRQIVIVHGGGPAINSVLGKLNIEAKFVDGLRVTCSATMDVVEMVLGGTINKQLVRKLLAAGASACGTSGVDAGMIRAKQKDASLGLVGQIEKIDSALIRTILDSRYIPVIAPLGVSEDGQQVFNLNADTAAGAIASALGAEKLVMITDVPGILRTFENGEKGLLPEAQLADIEKMIADGEIYGGMIPKVQAAIDALYQGVKQVVICRGTAEDLLAASSGAPVGTTIMRGVA